MHLHYFLNPGGIMTKTQKRSHQQKAASQDTLNEKKSVSSHPRSIRTSRIKEFSKKVLHDYVIPMTRIIEKRLLRLEQSL